MVLYVSKVFSVTLVGKTLKHVRCEKCGSEFDYELKRAAVGEGIAPYMMGQKSAQNAAASNAQSSLQTRLEREVELVPCPSCTWINEESIAIFRKSRHGGWIWFGSITGALALFTAFLFYVDGRDLLGRAPSFISLPFLISLILGLALVFGGILITSTLRRRISPNNPGAILPPCTPSAIVFDTERQQHILVPNTPPPDQDQKWAYYRSGELKFDPICCVCLKEATTFYRPPTTVGRFAIAPHSTLNVPLCNSCMNRIRLKWWLEAAANLLIAWALGRVLSYLHPGDREAKNFMFWVYMFLAAFAGFVFLHYFHLPYRLKVIDAIRGIWRIRFANPAYTALLIRRLAEEDGHK